jgi:hypothetical protein
MATNAVTTTSTTRANMGASTVLDGFLKDVYLPGITNTLYFDDEFSRTIQKRSDIFDATGRRIVHQFASQRSAGVGAFSEGGDFKTSVPVGGKQGNEWIKYLNLYFSLSGPAIATVKAGEGSYVDIVTQHIKSIGQSAKLDFERQCMGEQNGRLAIWSDSTVTTTADTTNIEVTGDAFFDTMFLEPGMAVEMRAPVNGTATLRASIDGSNDYSDIYAIDRKGTKKTGSVTRGRVKFGTTITGVVTQNDWITRRGAYTSGSASDCLEINGLRNLISDATDHSSDTNGTDESTGTNYTNIWNLARGTYEYLKSYVTYINAELDEENLLNALMELETTYGGNPNMLIVSKRAMLKYFLGVDSLRQFTTMNALNWVGGYTGLGIQLGTKQLMLTTINSVPSNHGFFINTNDFAFANATNGYQWLTKGGRILTQKEGSDNQFATAVNYTNLVCFDPQRQCKMYGITE